jgi:diguanylate cyclase (GGDEF)-like protein/putative nucleotidyltransferase with HDIG domain
LGKRQRVEDLERELLASGERVRELERELERRAVREPLTGLLTLPAFERRLDEEIERCRRHKRAMTLAIVDVDDFRASRGRHGRHVADDVLKAIARVLTASIRASDVASRVSANEFALMLPETSGTEALGAFKRIMLTLEGTRVGPVEAIAASVGLACYRHGMSGEQLMASAGRGLDRARSGGGGRSVLWDPGPDGAEPNPHEDAIAGLAEALLERDRYTGEHSESVVELAARVARGLGLDEREVERVRSAALLHDIGKVAIPDEVLHKAGALDDGEWDIMREHPAIGERILRAIPGLGGVARIVRHEHERYDGGGYPDGIKGSEIPIGSRIILACDAYHAMTSDRPYRTAMDHGDAIAELAKNAGTQFDPDVTEQLIGCLYGQRQATSPTAA